MEKIINHVSGNLRCVIKVYTDVDIKLRLQLQVCRISLWIFQYWVNLSHFVDVSEYTEEQSRIDKDDKYPKRGPNPIVLDYQYGDGKHEFWDYGTFDLKERVKKMFDEYVRAKSRYDSMKRRLIDKLNTL